MRDLLGPAQAGAALNSAEEDLVQTIGQTAQKREEVGVSRQTMDALAAIGWLAGNANAATYRERAEQLAMADASVWFCWLQHQSPLALLKGSGNSALQQRWLAALQGGRALGATAFAHLRRPGHPNPIAHHCSNGWLLNGRLDWVTSWDLADVVSVQLRTSAQLDAEVLAVLIELKTKSKCPEGLTAEAPLALMAMGGTWSRPVRLERCLIQEESVISVVPIQSWQAADQRKTRFANPAAFGLIRAALGDLHQQAESRHMTCWHQKLNALAKEAANLRHICYEAADNPSQVTDAEHHKMRAAALELAQHCCRTALISHGGAGMRAGHASGRRLREAMFLQVQALILPVQNYLIQEQH
jgi:alkylation response protein AidB-like acyl-CoA dehydrogenase